MAGPLLQRIKSWLRGRRAGGLYYIQNLFEATNWDADCQAALESIAKAALERGEVITTTSLLLALCPQLPLERAYGAQEADRFRQTLETQRENPRMQTAAEPKALCDHGVMMAVSIAVFTSREEDAPITVARLVGALLGQSFPTREFLERAGFDTMPLLRWAAHNTLDVRNHWPTGNFGDDPDAMYELLLINDSITTQEIVTRLLIQHLSVSPEAARTMMLETHNDGESLLAVSELEVVVALAEAIEGDARAAGSPLDLQIRPSA
tara:strand:- start:90143 stop:90937 length:795 start_codon:yes stop_codon:yes gene_type:complete